MRSGKKFNHEKHQRHENESQKITAIFRVVRKRPGKPFLPGSVVLGPVNSGLWAFSGEVSYERTGAGLA